MCQAHWGEEDEWNANTPLEGFSEDRHTW
jgi:hypothetical protein